MATKVKTIGALQDVLKKWFRQPGETDQQYRDRINNDPSTEISIDLFALPSMMHEQEEENGFESATPAIPLDHANKKDDDAA